MNKKELMKGVICKVLLINLLCFTRTITLFAQESIAEKIDYAKYLLNNYISSNKSETQVNKVKLFYEKCTLQEKEAIRSEIIKTLTDSLMTDNKQFALDYIDCYKLLAKPDDDYIGSLLMTQAKYYYEIMDSDGLRKVILSMEEILSQSTIDYKSELSKLRKMESELLCAGKDLLGYWVVDFHEKAMYPPFYVNIYKDLANDYHVDVIYDFHPDMKIYADGIKRDTGLNGDGHFRFNGKQTSLECLLINPNTLSYYWSSEDLKVGKEYLANSLRSGVRGISSNIVGNLARSNEYKTSTKVLGSIGSIFGEVLLNSIIDEVSVSKKTIQTITCTIFNKDRKTISAFFCMDYFKLRSDDSNIEHDSISFNVEMIKFDINDSYIENNIAFLTNKPNGGLGLTLRQIDYFPKDKKKEYYRKHPEAKELRNTMSMKKLTAYNREQIEKLKKYNKTH